MPIESFETLKNDELDEKDVNEDDKVTLKDSNTHEANHDARDTNSNEDVLDFNTINGDKDDVFVEDDNDKKRPDWDALKEDYGDMKVGVMLDLDTLYQEYVLEK